MIIKQNSKLASQIRHNYENILMYDRSDHALIHVPIYDFSQVKTFCE